MLCVYLCVRVRLRVVRACREIADLQQSAGLGPEKPKNSVAWKRIPKTNAAQMPLVNDAMNATSLGFSVQATT